MANDTKIHLTQEGFAALKTEYDELINNKRPSVVQRLAEARQMGDLAENNEYTTAREELAFLDGRAEELEDVIANAEIISRKNDCSEVDIGCRVTVETSENNKQIFHLVGEWEADPVTKKISFSSPLGKSLLGKKVGDEVEVEAPAGKVIYTVKEIA